MAGEFELVGRLADSMVSHQTGRGTVRVGEGGSGLPRKTRHSWAYPPVTTGLVKCCGRWGLCCW